MPSLLLFRYRKVWCILGEGQMSLYSSPPPNSKQYCDCWGSDEQDKAEKHAFHLLLHLNFREEQPSSSSSFSATLDAKEVKQKGGIELSPTSVAFLPEVKTSQHITGSLFPLSISHQGCTHRLYMSEKSRPIWFPILLWNIHSHRHGLERFNALIPEMR